MGVAKVSTVKSENQMKQFVENLLNDMRALEIMLEKNMFESDVVRIGAEQELVMVDATTFKPALINTDVLRTTQEYDWLDTELAKFNLETNLAPHVFMGDALRKVEDEVNGHLAIIREKLKPFNAKVVLTGILPTLRKFDLDMENLTPRPRYRALMEAIDSQLQGAAFELRLTGIDEILVRHNSPLLEACNTSFQVHLQVAPSQFVCYYNIAQALAAPIMAIAANSPIVFGRRLWHETRIALFQQALDTRTTHDHLRERSPRVHFGNGWVTDSILDIYREDIARFRVLLAGDDEEHSLEVLESGRIPKLRALQVHNSTVYRWNRPCYGISENGKPHLRIENRVLPSGPTVVDEVANASFWLGAMVGMAGNCADITKRLAFEDVRDNFMKAAKFGIDSEFNWFDDQKIGVCELILQELLPIARQGLRQQNINPEDIDRYLGIIEERAKRHMNGARWQLRAFTKLKNVITKDEAVTVLTAAIVKNQEKEMPVHTWELPGPGDLDEYRPSRLRVEEFMETDLFTVQRDDIIDLVAELMDWRKIRYMPVEDSKGRLVGLMTSRILLRHFTKNRNLHDQPTLMVKDIMIKEPYTIGPNSTILEALDKMRTNKIGCLPVVIGENELVGIITEMDFLRISARLMERLESR
jgi:CBS domain-containing protein